MNQQSSEGYCYERFTFLFLYYSWIRRHAALAQPFHFIAIYFCLRCLNAASWYASLQHTASMQPST